MAIVGAGPAGLIAATALARSDPRKAGRIVLFDSGPDVSTRRALFASRSEPRARHVISGCGGAGLYSDGKLSIANVGNDLPLSPVEFDACLGEVITLLAEYLPEKALEPELVTPPHLDRFERLGLRLRVTPTIHLGTDGAFSLTQRLEDMLRAQGVGLRFNETVHSISLLEDGNFVLTTDVGTYNVRVLVLATGKAGAAFMAREMEKLGVRRVINKLSLGLRVETRAENLRGLLRFGLNPKIYREETASGVIATKTFCICHGGILQPYLWNGIPLVGGHSLSGRAGRLSNLAVLSEIRADAFPGLMEHLAAQHSSKPLVESLAGFLAASEEPLAGVETSLPDWLPFPVHAIYPESIYTTLKRFLADLPALDDRIRLDGALVAAFALEEVSPKVVADENMETGIRNLIVVGDGSGMTEGIIPAMISGLIGARTLIRKLGS